MLNKLKLGTAVLALMGSAAQAEKLVIYHNWSSPAEVGALGVLKTALEAGGDEWTDIAIPHDTGSNVSLMSLVTGGTPPNVFLEASPGFYRDLTGLGMGLPLTKMFTDAGITAHFPEAVVKSITVDGEIMKIPTAIHIDGMIYYNLEVAKAAGVDPAAWKTFDEMFADFEKVKAAGYIPIAIGAQAWQIGYLTHALAAALEGPEFYNKIYSETVDPAALDSAEMRDLLTWLRKFQSVADPGSVNRDWNVTTNTVITGQALMQLHGDWMKGEWRAAGKEAGKDFGCVTPPGAKALSVTVDSWGLLGGQSEEKTAAEMRFAAIVADPVVQADFAAIKGSTPTRLDAPQDKLDICSHNVLEALANPAIQVQNPNSMVDADWMSSLWDVYFAYWSDPTMTADTAIAKMVENYDTILN